MKNVVIMLEIELYAFYPVKTDVVNDHFVGDSHNRVAYLLRRGGGEWRHLPLHLWGVTHRWSSTDYFSAKIKKLLVEK